ncbi:MAG: phage terminase large subunit [Oscillospiraceae bacterium]|jgi:phage terminase large subunit|nr:phage terminase large subunit [Oscillospiraceae bacterium]
MNNNITIDLGAPSPKQAQFYRSRTLYTAYGGAKGGGKTHAVRVKAVAGALRHAGLRCLIVRRSYPELQASYIEPILAMVPEDVAEFSATRRALYFTNGSVIRFGNFRQGAARREYQGQEFDWIFLDEATQFTESEFRELGACLRGATDVPRRFYLTCNPGGIGHAWVKRLFIDRDYRDGERAEDYSFIFASVEDNLPLLKNSPEYARLLESLPDNLRRAYRHGDWDALSGAYFDEFDANLHVVAPSRIPKTWQRFRAFDYGLDMLACLWIAVSPEGKCVVYRELRRSGLVVSQAAREISRLTLPDENIIATLAPPDMWSRQKDSGRTMAELYAQGGIYLTRASSDRVSGHIQIKELLRGDESGAPRLTIFASCDGLIRDVARIACSDANPNDCATVPHDCTHAVDALRYFCSSRLASSPSPVSVVEEDYEVFMTRRWR